MKRILYTIVFILLYQAAQSQVLNENHIKSATLTMDKIRVTLSSGKASDSLRACLRAPQNYQIGYRILT